MRVKYRTTHFPTGTVTETECDCNGIEDFLRHINRWNIAGNGEYLYVACDIQPVSLVAHDFKSIVEISTMRSPESVAEHGGWWTDLAKRG